MNAHQAVTAPRTAAKTLTSYFFAMVFTVARIIIPIPPIFALGDTSIEILVWSIIALARLL
jgi:hypothetical protein